MTTINQVVDRLLRTYLEPPDAQGPEAILGSSVVNELTDMITLSSFQVPEDEALMRQGLILEIDAELMKVVGYNAPVVAVQRGQMDTKAVPHTVGAAVKLAPAFPRQTIFESLCSNIIGVGAKLYTVQTDYVSSLEDGVAPVGKYAISEVRFVPDHPYMRQVMELPGRIVDFAEAAGGRAFIVEGGYMGSGYLTYRKRMAMPTSFTDTLADLGIEDSWVTLLQVGVAADLLIGRDIPQTQQDFISKSLEAEAVPISTRANIGFALRRYRNDLLREAAAEMDQEYGITMSYRDPFTRAGS